MLFGDDLFPKLEAYRKRMYEFSWYKESLAPVSGLFENMMPSMAANLEALKEGLKGKVAEAIQNLRSMYGVNQAHPHLVDTDGDDKVSLLECECCSCCCWCCARARVCVVCMCIMLKWWLKVVYPCVESCHNYYHCC